MNGGEAAAADAAVIATASAFVSLCNARLLTTGDVEFLAECIEAGATGSELLKWLGARMAPYVA